MDFPIQLSDSAPKPKSNSKLTKTGKILVGLTGGVAVGLTVVCASFVSPALRKYCLPYVPATKAQIDNILVAVKGRQGSVLDLGSGDGRIVLELAKRNFDAHGVELNFWLVMYSKLDALRKGLSGKAKFSRRDLWKVNFNQYNNIVIFGVQQMMKDLEKKFEAECTQCNYVVACRFPLPNRIPTATIGTGIDTVWTYIIEK